MISFRRLSEDNVSMASAELDIASRLLNTGKGHIYLRGQIIIAFIA